MATVAATPQRCEGIGLSGTPRQAAAPGSAGRALFNGAYAVDEHADEAGGVSPRRLESGSVLHASRIEDDEIRDLAAGDPTAIAESRRREADNVAPNHLLALAAEFASPGFVLRSTEWGRRSAEGRSPH